jgi:hypothetical protein
MLRRLLRFPRDLFLPTGSSADGGPTAGLWMGPAALACEPQWDPNLDENP